MSPVDRMGRTSLVFTCAALLALLTGCGVQGTPTAAEVDVRTLDVGPYPVDRHSYDETAGDDGPLVEGMRMSQAVVPTVDIDPALTVGAGGRVVVDSADVTDNHLVATVSKPVLDRNKMVTGYVAGGQDKLPSTDNSAPPTAVTNLVMRFPDEDSAQKAAQELEDVDFGVAPDLNRKLSLPEYPDAHIHYRPGVPNIGTFMAYKQFVISLFIETPTADEDTLLSWVRKTLDAQVPALDRFEPTPMSDLADLPVDPGGLLARAVVRDRSNRTPDPDTFAVYGAPAVVHIAANEVERRKLVDATGLDAVALADDSSVMRVRDAEAGARLIDGLTANSKPKYEATDAPPDVPNAKCVTLTDRVEAGHDSRFRCYVPYRRYVGIINADERGDMNQRISAAYALLANSF